MKYLSIVTLSKNNYSQISETFDSIRKSLDVDFKDLEIVHVDKSIDSTKAESFGTILPESCSYNFLCQLDNGIFNAMNFGLRNSVGKYIWFLNTGDLVNDNYTISKLLKECKRNDVAMIYGDVEMLSESNMVYKKSSSNIDNCLRLYSQYFPCHQSCIFRTAIHLQNPYPELFGADEFIIRKFFKNKFGAKYLDFSLSIFDLNGISSIQKISFLVFWKRCIGYIKLNLLHRILADLSKIWPFFKLRLIFKKKILFQLKAFFFLIFWI